MTGGNGTAGGPRLFTREEVAKHTGPPQFVWSEEKQANLAVPGTEPYIILHNKVYEVTAWLDDHPGGEAILLANAGTDATERFEQMDHSQKARDKRDGNFLIGELVPEDHQIWRKHVEEAQQSSSSSMRGKLTWAIGAVLLALYVRTAMKSRPIPQVTYSKALRHVHLVLGLGVLGSIGFVQAASRSEGPTKKRYLSLHKGSGLVLFLALFVRVWLRLNSAIPPRFPGPRALHLFEGASHRLLYLILFLQPVSGMWFQYFYYSKSEPDESDERTAMRAINFHKQLGKLFEYLCLPIHLGISAFHYAKGRSVVRRISPFI